MKKTALNWTFALLFIGTQLLSIAFMMLAGLSGAAGDPYQTAALANLSSMALCTIAFAVIAFASRRSYTLDLDELRIRDAAGAKRRVPVPPEARAGVGAVLVWGVLGAIMLFVGQGFAGFLESVFGIQPGSENTQEAVGMVMQVPLFAVAVSVLAPFNEEIVFRKALFGSLAPRMNVWLAAVLSSLAFALVHLEPRHLLIYFTMGLVLTFLYYQTKRIWTSILAHVLMNTAVFALQWMIAEKILDVPATPLILPFGLH